MIVKEILKLFLVLQFLAGTLASVFPLFDIDGQPLGKEKTDELLGLKPVRKTSTTPDGFTKTTSYKLEPDGSISSKSVWQKSNHYLYNGDSMPEELKNIPKGSVTRTFTDSDGNKVTQTVAVDHRNSLTVRNPAEDYENWPMPTWPHEIKAAQPFGKAHNTFTRTYTGPHGETRTIQTWTSDKEFAAPETPLAAKHYIPNRDSTNTRIYGTPIENKHVEPQTTNSGNLEQPLPKFPPINWPSYDYSAFSQPWDNPDPEDLDAWEELTEGETSTKNMLQPGTQPSSTTVATTTSKANTLTETQPKKHKTIPDLHEFLQSQYGQKGPTEPVTSTSPKYVTTTTQKPLTTTPKLIHVEDLPVAEVLYNGKPASQTILKTLPPHLTPRTPSEPTLSIEHKHPLEEPIEEDTEEEAPKPNTIRTFTTTHIGPNKPTLKDLDPHMQDILRNAGIVPELEGDTVTKTRQEPDGRIITTSYRVNTVPLQHASTSRKQYYMPPLYKLNSYKPEVPVAPSIPHPSPIMQFLAKFGLTKLDIASRNGHYSKTFIDENGDVLTATFVLSSPQGMTAAEEPKEKPLK